MAGYLIVFGTIHILNALAGPEPVVVVDRAAAGLCELVLGVWAARSWESSLITLVTLLGVWAISRGVTEMFAGFTLRQVAKQGAPAGRMTAGRAASSASARRDAIPAEAALFKRLASARAGAQSKEQK